MIKQLRVDWVERYWSMVKTCCLALNLKCPKRGGNAPLDVKVFDAPKTPTLGYTAEELSLNSVPDTQEVTEQYNGEMFVMEDTVSVRLQPGTQGHLNILR